MAERDEYEKALDVLADLAEDACGVLERQGATDPCVYCADVLGVDAGAFIEAAVFRDKGITAKPWGADKKGFVRWAAAFLVGYLLGSGQIELPKGQEGGLSDE